jgi:hypothetical protein
VPVLVVVGAGPPDEPDDPPVPVLVGVPLVPPEVDLPHAPVEHVPAALQFPDVNEHERLSELPFADPEQLPFEPSPEVPLTSIFVPLTVPESFAPAPHVISMLQPVWDTLHVLSLQLPESVHFPL